MGKRGKDTESPGLRIAFCHPDLGLGGAERLIVDAATELAERHHEVDVYTAFYDPNRCFEETKSGIFRVIVTASWFPRSIFGRAMALCAYIRCMFIAMAICFQRARYDVVIVDQVSVAVIILRLFSNTQILFYCHFPDLLLASPKSRLHKLYRLPLNTLEEWSTGLAHRVLVNSQFTRSVFANTFRGLHKKHVLPNVLYPAVAIPADNVLEEMKTRYRAHLPENVLQLIDSRPVFLSINRFERKKNINLAIKALKHVETGKGQIDPGLIVAGGYDVRLAENVEHLQELKKLAEKLGLKERVVFFPSFSDKQRLALLIQSMAVIYTPTNEHFGIVPIEAMATATPVIACDSGGPKESIVNGKTGYLVDSDEEKFAKAMEKCLDKEVCGKLGKEARQHVLDKFSRKAFGNRLDTIVRDMIDDSSKKMN